MIFRASEFHQYYQPSPCDLRVYLSHKETTKAKPSPFAEVMKTLGIRHERSHLESLSDIVDLSSGEDRERRTIEAVGRREAAIYQPRFTAMFSWDGIKCEVVGEPDFLIRTPDGYIIRDSKMARRITEKEHPEIVLQLQLYGWLYEQVIQEPPYKLEVHAGTGNIVEIPFQKGTPALDHLKKIISIKLAQEFPYSPVGWSKCGGCDFNDQCWERATTGRDVSIVIGVDQNLAKALKSADVHTLDDLLKKFNETTLSNFQKTVGATRKRVGRDAPKILRNAQAIRKEKEIVFSQPAIPSFKNYVMFDLEGMPPHLNELEKIYLWGLQVYGETPNQYQPALAGFGRDGDFEGWNRFLDEASTIFRKFGDIPFVHWASYERTHIDKYITRFGDQKGIAERVKRNLLDLLPITRDSIALPLPSFSLKVIEKFIGYKRKQEEFGGQWSMAKYIEATETEDSKTRDEVMNEILIYNQEDLDSMWAIFEWVRSRPI